MMVSFPRVVQSDGLDSGDSTLDRSSDVGALPAQRAASPRRYSELISSSSAFSAGAIS